MQPVLQKMQYMTNEESYTQRRMLFKDIWETAMNIDGKEDIMNKPKVIKTLRLDEVDKCIVGRSKKQRIKNLRHVCNRILDFCDRQDADDVFYEQFAVEDQRSIKAEHKVSPNPKHLKKKTHNNKKKIIKAKSATVSHKDVKRVKKSISERKTASKIKPPTIATPVAEIRNAVIKTNYPKIKPKAAKSKPSPMKHVSDVALAETITSSNGSTKSRTSGNKHRRIKKKHSRKKKPDLPAKSTGLEKSKTVPIQRPPIKTLNQSKTLPILTKVMINH